MTVLWRISICSAELPVPCSRAWTWALSTRSSKKASAHFRLTLDAGAAKKSRSPVPGLFRHPGAPGPAGKQHRRRLFQAHARSRPPTPPWSEQFEPGSIVKIVSLLAYLRQSGDGLFPLVCPGRITIGGKVFSDRIEHGQVQRFCPGPGPVLQCQLRPHGDAGRLRRAWPTCCSAFVSTARPWRTGSSNSQPAASTARSALIPAWPAWPWAWRGSADHGSRRRAGGDFFAKRPAFSALSHRRRQEYPRSRILPPCRPAGPRAGRRPEFHARQESHGGSGGKMKAVPATAPAAKRSDWPSRPGPPAAPARGWTRS